MTKHGAAIIRSILGKKKTKVPKKGVEKCFYCPAIGNTKDHVIPLSLGGKKNGKKVPACMLCNVTRGNMPQELFIKFMDYVKDRGLMYSDFKRKDQARIRKSFTKKTGIVFKDYR